MQHSLPTIILLMSAIVLSAHAQRHELGRELAPFGQGTVEEALLWDFDRQSAVDERSGAYVRLSCNVLYENAAGVCRAYFLRGDTAVYRGYNVGRRERMLADSMVNAYCLPAGFSSSYAAHGLLDFDLRQSAVGEIECKVYGPGRMVAYGDTLRGVYVVAERHLEYASCSDSLPAVPTNILIYKWLSVGSPLPLALQCESEGGRRLYVADASVFGDFKNEDGIAEEEAVALMLANAEAWAEGGRFVIDFGKAAADASIIICLVDINGYAFLQECLTLRAGDEASFSFPIPQSLSGRHIVSLSSSGNPQLSRKIYVDL